MSNYLQSTLLVFSLLNPFLVIVYLIDVVEKLDRHRFQRVIIGAGLIAAAVFCAFAWLGDLIFTGFVQAEFASFQIFGGIIFLLIGLQFVFRGPKAVELLRGDAGGLVGAIAMPVLIGPGTISACVVVGQRHSPWVACTIVVVSLIASLLVIIVLKHLHDILRSRNAAIIQQYVEISGRITALYVGTVSVEMIMRGLAGWIEKF